MLSPRIRCPLAVPRSPAWPGQALPSPGSRVRESPKGKVVISLTDFFFFLSFIYSFSLPLSLSRPLFLSHPPNPPLSLPVSLVTHILIDARSGVTGWCWHESSSKEKEEQGSGSEEGRRPVSPHPRSPPRLAVSNPRPRNSSLTLIQWDSYFILLK